MGSVFIQTMPFLNGTRSTNLGPVVSEVIQVIKIIKVIKVMKVIISTLSSYNYL